MGRKWADEHPEKHKATFDKYRANQRAKDPDWDERNALKKNYGITLEHKIQMMTAQDNKCAICFKSFMNRGKACIDHEHKTGKIRQLLCHKCNTAIGMFYEDVSILQSAIEYLKKWS